MLSKDYSEEWYEGFKKSLPDTRLVTQDFNNTFNKGKDMQSNTDSVSEILNWFKAAKPEPTNKDICTQIGCHFEEVSEMQLSLGDTSMCHKIDQNAQYYKDGHMQVIIEMLKGSNKREIELLDSLCDQIVTAIGVGYMNGFDIQGALKEVIRSNNSKMVDGGFIFDTNGKIMKPDSFSEPDLTPFLGVGSTGV